MSLALSSYRHLLRSARIAFQGDLPVLHAARSTIRDSFRNNSSIDPSSPEYAPAIAHAEEVAKLLRENIVQGKKIEGDERYKLRIHEHTERGDNDTIKMPNGKVVTIDGKKCSD